MTPWTIVYGAAVFTGVVLGVTWSPPAETEAGLASVYSTASNGGTVVACPGQKLDDVSLLAAHRTFPCGAKVRVTSLENGKLVDVRIIDRGPYVAGRIIDLNPAAALVLGVNGLAKVSITKM